MEEKYFAASNSKNGFFSYYSDAFGCAERVYIIKGGPGTGKSYFMRQVANAAEGTGHSVVYIYCSSDPESLDGILIDRRIALLDGTAPHTVDAVLPVVRDEIIDLASFLSRSALEGNFSKINELSKSKSLCYARAYDALGAAGKLSAAAEKLVSPYVLKEKLLAAAARYLKPILQSNEYKATNLAQKAIGMRGFSEFSTLEDKAVISFSIRDRYGISPIFLNALIAEAERKKLPSCISHDPVIPENPDALLLCGELLFTASPIDGARIVNTERFVDKAKISSIKKEYKALVTAKESVQKCAMLALSDAARCHFELEKIYTAAINFTEKEKFTKQFIKSLMLALK